MVVRIVKAPDGSEEVEKLGQLSRLRQIPGQSRLRREEYSDTGTYARLCVNTMNMACERGVKGDVRVND